MTARRFAFYAAAGALVYAAVLVATVPAPWVSRAIAKVSGQKLEMREPEGTLWSGSAATVSFRPEAGVPMMMQRAARTASAKSDVTWIACGSTISGR